MVAVVFDSALGDVRELSDFELDLAFGSDENAFSLECDAAYAPTEGQFVSIDGTEYGGVIDQASYEAGREASGSILCRGRTWHGILAGKRLLPDSGSGYLSVSGKAGDALAALIERMGLSELFSAASDDTSVSYTRSCCLMAAIIAPSYFQTPCSGGFFIFRAWKPPAPMAPDPTESLPIPWVNRGNAPDRVVFFSPYGPFMEKSAFVCRKSRNPCVETPPQWA